MRSIGSILLVAILLFNAVGYYALFIGLQYKHDRNVEESFNNGNYSAAETFTIKIPLAIPYTMDVYEFERIDGKFECNGEFYRLIKQRLAEDTLIVVCFRDRESKRISEIFCSYSKSFANNPATPDKNTSRNFYFLKDYLVRNFSLESGPSGHSRELTSTMFRKTSPPGVSSPVYQPPEFF